MFKPATILLVCMTATTLHLSAEPTELPEEEELLIADDVGKVAAAEDSEIASRDRYKDVPMLYDRNRMELMRQRDRWLRNHGMCYPPPGVIVSPQIYVPCPKGGRVTRYDPRNPIYRTWPN